MNELSIYQSRKETYQKKKPSHRREMGTLADEIARSNEKRIKQIEAELMRRYQAGEQAAYYEGINQDG
ncbi:MAG: hypothetical protein AAF984_10185 [Verrucomicrobiota bacterium]